MANQIKGALVAMQANSRSLLRCALVLGLFSGYAATAGADENTLTNIWNKLERDVQRAVDKIRDQDTAPAEAAEQAPAPEQATKSETSGAADSSETERGPEPVVAKPPAASPARSGASFEQELVRDVQTLLAERNYDPGPIDGLYGRRTKRAIEAYERDAARPVTGIPSYGLVKQLTRERERPAQAALKVEPPAQQKAVLETAGTEAIQQEPSAKAMTDEERRAQEMAELARMAKAAADEARAAAEKAETEPRAEDKAAGQAAPDETASQGD